VKRALLGTGRDFRTEGRAFIYTLIPHENNSDTRKALTVILFILWGVMGLGIQAGYPAPTEIWGGLTAFVFWRMGKIQEQEADRVDSENSK